MPHIWRPYRQMWAIGRERDPLSSILLRDKISSMPLGLRRYQHEGDDHFITFSCYRREPYFAMPDARDTFLASLELMRQPLLL